MSYKDFDAGVDTVVPYLELECHMNGLFWPDLTQYTCTRHCGEPYRNKDLMEFDWDPSEDTDIGQTVM